MKALQNVFPSPEQLTIVKRVRSGVELIRGSAGSGKTTTAILKLKLLLAWVTARRRRTEDTQPVRALVLTFNKTLKGYIQELVNENITPGRVEVTVDTFAHWAVNALNRPTLTNSQHLEILVIRNAQEIGLPASFLQKEVEYAMGRFLPENIDEYLTCRRDGRGASPRVERNTRQLVIEKIIQPYAAWKAENGTLDWNDLAVKMAKERHFAYDIIIADESQDFSANELRAINAQVAEDCALTFIIDTAQRIYARGFTWNEVGFTIRPENSHRLTVNYRNTPEIAKLAASLINCVTLDDDGTQPQLAGLEDNPRPVVLQGKFRKQADWCIQYIRDKVDLSKESVAFLHPKGRGWFEHLESVLKQAGIDYIDITGRSEWPVGEVNVALSTLHSAKGLDFDHCIIIGIDKKGLPEGDYEMGDDRFEHACRLLSMAIARARKGVVIGYKPGEQPAILERLDVTAFDTIAL